MKYIKLFESFEDIDSICKKWGIRNYTINPDGTVDVDGDVNLSFRGLTELPLKFGVVSGGFYCHGNKLTTLEGAPKEVGGNFYCLGNPIWNIYELYPDYDTFLDSIEVYNYLRGTNIVKGRFSEAMEDINREVPESIPGYKYI